MDRFFIAPFDNNSGLQRNVKPFMITDQAFQNLNNAYAWRGRIRKRFGSRWLGNTQLLTRLRIKVDTTDGGGTSSGTVPTGSGAVGQMFSIGTNIFTVNVLGTPANLLIDGAASTATFNTTTGVFVFTGVPALTPVYWYPALPVMGMATFFSDLTNNAQPLIAFDTMFAYVYTAGWDRLGTGAAATWSGNNSQFFWFTTYISSANLPVLFVTNFNQNEAQYMRYLVSGTTTWVSFRPQLDSTPTYLDAARILIPFQNRLLAFNTWEENGGKLQFAHRLRWSGPAGGDPTAVNAWRDDIPGNGGFLDCPTVENVVTVEFIKDRLIVFLEESTWEIVYTANQVNPFRWQQINTELGAEGTFSVVPFDKVVLGVGNLGLIACTGTNVDRIDDKIPDEVFDIHLSDQGPKRVYGIRDYFVEMVYWTFPDPVSNASFPYPNRILVYNYKNGTWAFNDDSFTVFGYFQPSPSGILWSDSTVLWSSSTKWNSPTIQALFRQVAAGNQEGWTVIIDADEPVNAPALQITNITIGANNVLTLNVIDHNLRTGNEDQNPNYIYIQDVADDGNIGDNINNKIFPVLPLDPEDPNNFTIVLPVDPVITGTYLGGGVIARVSNIQLLTKQYNFYMDKGRNASVSKVDFLVDTTQYGAIQVDFYISTSDLPMLTSSDPVVGTGSIVGTGVLETFPYTTFEETSSQVWHPYYIQADGEFIQLDINMNDEQMRDVNIREQEFELHAMLFWAKPTASRPQ